MKSNVCSGHLIYKVEHVMGVKKSYKVLVYK
jgi:hypothetical protein